jgi:hypothetical protein
MKYAMLAALALLALSPVAFAQTWCEQDCCEESGGSWDSDYSYCDGPGSSYYQCLSDYCSTESYQSGSGSSSVSCCGTGFILAAIGGAAFMSSRGSGL